MNAELYNGYWISTDTYLSQTHRDSNAELVYQYLHRLGWTREAIAGILGNMDVESTMNPALIEGRNVHTLINNNTCLNIGGSTGVGLVQWTGTTNTPPAGQKLASFAIRYNQNWYDGNLQCFRLEREYDTDIQFNHGTVDGQQWDWQTYVTSTATPEQLAKVWQYGREVTTLVVECCRVVQNMFLATQIGSELTHGLIAKPKSEWINDVYLLYCLVLVGIGKVHAVVVAYVCLIGVCSHLSYFCVVAGKVRQ